MTDLRQPRYCVANTLHRTARAVSRIYSEEMRPCGIKRSQFAILGNLNYLGVVQLSELATIMIVDRTTLSRNLKPLEKQGLIFINRSPKDARVKELSLTRQGKAKFNEALKLWHKAQARVLEKFGDSNWQALESSLAELREKLN
ncbi:MAG: MarR family winged helix-turn-helix transcriptional regulator [Pseudomonadales bacterium]|nr:MarR family winged helix-turn-helix transcriptional regulator [Pseudomonadales bacterium]